MAVLQIAVRAGSPDLEAAVVMEEFVACGDKYIVVAECDTAQSPVAAAAFEVDLARVPVDQLLDILILKIDRKYAAVTLTFPAATYDGCCDELWQFVCHSSFIK